MLVCCAFAASWGGISGSGDCYTWEAGNNVTLTSITYMCDLNYLSP